MKVIETPLNDVFIIEPEIFGDDRGFFFESFNLKQFRQLTGVMDDFVQDNHSKSQQSVLRGLHYQTQQTQGKLVRVIAGEIYDVAVDLRQTSSTFGQIFGLLLDAEKHQQLWVPKGFAHGFVVTSKEAQVLYKTTDYYAPEYEQSINWNDQDLNIPWPLNGRTPALSSKDKQGHSFKDAHYFS
jgi:dTDP-4-dehydrorhamnose 3,5-epimerase